MNTVKTLSRYFSVQKARLAWYVLLAVIHGFMVLPIPLILRFIIDRVPNSRWDSIASALVALLLVSSVDIALSAMSRFGIVKVVKEGVQKVQHDAVRTIVKSHHRSAWAQYAEGLKDVIVNDTYRLDLALTIGLSQVLPAIISMVVLLGALFVLSPVLFLISCGVLPLGLIALVYSRNKVSTLQERFRRAMVSFEERVGFTIRAWELVKMQTAERAEDSAYEDLVGNVRQSGGKLAYQQTILQLFQEGVGAVFGIVLLGFGFFLSSRGELSISQVVSFFVGFSLLRAQIATLFMGWPHVVMLHDALSRIEQVLAISQETPYSGTVHHEVKGEISLRNISLSVGGDTILRNANAVFKAGELSVVEGKNGAGKTTLLFAILGLLVPDAGDIFIDGASLRTIDISSYRRQIGVVSQEAIFLNASVKENEQYGLGGGQVSVLGRSDFFIDGTRDTASLSGGEKQRLMISRALERRPKILFLDEATNHLDEEYRNVLFARLKSLLPTTTIICITHDQSLIAIADARYEISDGRIITL
ncbi:MAG: ABC transporter ATP-binding protein/permease [Candidatus Andersenbacteria bacterium]|nr:ABC transporter ATP-binding protein/permease [Candidatus Andersenbacteria bacterium]